MAKRKGVSADEKRTRMLDIFYEKKEFFQLKELEKIGPKEKGIIAQSVKDVVKSLVDDNLVETDKIGTSVYFWAFPSKATQVKKRKLQELQNEFEAVKNKLKVSRERVIAAKVGREETEKRIKLLPRLQAMKVDEEKITLEIQKYRDSDPEMLEKLKNEIQMAKDAANRWTDGIFTTKSWCKQKFNIEESALDKQFNIPADLDYMD